MRTTTEMLIERDPPTTDMRTVCFDWHDGDQTPIMRGLGFTMGPELTHRGRPLLTGQEDLERLLAEVVDTLCVVRESKIKHADRDQERLEQLRDWTGHKIRQSGLLVEIQSLVEQAREAGVPEDMIRRIENSD